MAIGVDTAGPVLGGTERVVIVFVAIAGIITDVAGLPWSFGGAALGVLFAAGVGRTHPATLIGPGAPG